MNGKSSASRVSGAAAKEQLKTLINKLNEVLQKMQGLTTLNKLVELLRTIEEQEQSQQLLMVRIQKLLEDRNFNDLLDPGKKPEDKKPDWKKP